MTLRRNSPAKINLVLNILGRRPDGFHELETIIQPIPLFDTLTFRRNPDGFQFTTSHPDLPSDERNLVVRTAQAFFSQTGLKPEVSIELEKQIPVSAGLGGGSGNAAITLQALNEMFGTPLDPPQMQSLAAGIGSDVPCFLYHGPCLATGRGELIEPLNPFPGLDQYWLLLVRPSFGVHTPWAYQEYARRSLELGNLEGKTQEFLIAARRSWKEGWRRLFNALEFPVFAKYPVLSLYKSFFQSEGAEVSLMSGSGSTVFAIYQEESIAQTALEKFRRRFGTDGWSSVLSLHGLAEPV